jgi:hypothetical protein
MMEPETIGNLLKIGAVIYLFYKLPDFIKHIRNSIKNVVKDAIKETSPR